MRKRSAVVLAAALSSLCGRVECTSCRLAAASASTSHVRGIRSIRSQSLPYIININRGGGGLSDTSRQAWSTGSNTYDYRPSKSPRKNAYSRPSPTLGVPSEKGLEDATKEQFAEAFLRREDRQRFISRVYAILSGQLLVTAAAVHLFHLNPGGIRDWMMYTQVGRRIPLIGLAVSTIAYMLTLSPNNAQSSIKWPLLIIFTLGESVAVGFISSIYAYSTVIKAALTTAVATGSITAYTLLQKNPQYDLSQWGRALSGLSVAFLLYGLIHVLEIFGIVPRGFLPYTEALYCMFGAGLFSLYLAHHTRLIVGGKSAKYQMNEKDYVLGAMSLYSDIVNIFIYILRILGDVDD
mmetsp:Transcript_33248/g.79419  ORF Transcript_33248/g.79419 Transcript_33248/m.79419 type:complete len:351 (+) Transcript_33248:336-1388(+)